MLPKAQLRPEANSKANAENQITDSAPVASRVPPCDAHQISSGLQMKSFLVHAYISRKRRPCQEVREGGHESGCEERRRELQPVQSSPKKKGRPLRPPLFAAGCFRGAFACTAPVISSPLMLPSERQSTVSPIPSRSRPFSGRSPGTAEEVWLGTPSRQNAPDPVRTNRRTEPETKRRRQARDVRLSGIHAHQRERPERELHRKAQDDRQAHEGEAAGNQTATVSAHA